MTPRTCWSWRIASAAGLALAALAAGAAWAAPAPGPKGIMLAFLIGTTLAVFATARAEDVERAMLLEDLEVDEWNA